MNRDRLIADEIINNAFGIAYLSSFETLISRNPEADVFLDDAKQMIEPRLTNLLLATAGTLRNFVFENRPMHIPRKEWDQEFDSRHRKIAILLDEGELNIREACNKLLHSKEIRFVVSDSPMTSQLAPRFNLSECAEIKGALGRELDSHYERHEFCSCGIFFRRDTCRR